MKLEFEGRVWIYPGAAAWHFVSLPSEYTADLKLIGGSSGFGSIRVLAKINNIEWQTSIFPDTKSGCYLLPLKKDIRFKTGLTDGSIVRCTLDIRVQ